jgi:uncharacterized membrane protein YwaF
MVSIGLLFLLLQGMEQSISHSYLLVGLVLLSPTVAYKSDPTHLYGGELQQSLSLVCADRSKYGHP